MNNYEIRKLIRKRLRAYKENDPYVKTVRDLTALLGCDMNSLVSRVEDVLRDQQSS